MRYLRFIYITLLNYFMNVNKAQESIQVGCVLPAFVVLGAGYLGVYHTPFIPYPSLIPYPLDTLSLQILTSRRNTGPEIPYPPTPQKGHGTRRGPATRDTLLPPMNKLTDACENNYLPATTVARVNNFLLIYIGQYQGQYRFLAQTHGR